MSLDPNILLTDLFQTAVAAAHPRQVLPGHLPAPGTTGRTIVIGAGKAAAAMAETVEATWPGEISGLVVTGYGHGAECQQIEVVEAAHPVPDDASERVARRVLDLVSDLDAADQVLFLLSGGGSSLLALPAAGLTLQDKQQISKALLRCGAAIDEINCVRKHLSAIKGGRLALACYPARVHTCAISDVPGDDPAVIASGPTVADPSTSADALAIMGRYHIDVPVHVRAWLEDPRSETIKPGDPGLAHSHFSVIATPQQALQAAAQRAASQGITPLILGDLAGESRELARAHADIVRQVLTQGQPVKPPCVILSGGETTVTVRGHGRGGRCTEFLLSLTECLRGEPGIWALAADTDGIDGCGDNAGALMTPQTWQQALARGLQAADYLANNDSYSYFEAVNGLIMTGPTRTNVNDFRAVLIL